MSKQLTFEYKNKKYTLEFNREAIRRMEHNGFVIGKLGDMPMTLMPQLFAGAFYMHHPTVDSKTIEEIYNDLPDKTDLFAALGELYSEPMESLMTEPTSTKKITWAKNW